MGQAPGAPPGSRTSPLSARTDPRFGQSAPGIPGGGCHSPEAPATWTRTQPRRSVLETAASGQVTGGPVGDAMSTSCWRGREDSSRPEGWRGWAECAPGERAGRGAGSRVWRSGCRARYKGPRGRPRLRARGARPADSPPRPSSPAAAVGGPTIPCPASSARKLQDPERSDSPVIQPRRPAPSGPRSPEAPGVEGNQVSRTPPPGPLTLSPRTPGHRGRRLRHPSRADSSSAGGERAERWREFSGWRTGLLPSTR